MTFTANLRLAITLSIVSLLAVVGIVSYAKGGSDERANPAYDRVLFACETVDISDMGDDMLALLGSIGYKGDYRDSRDDLMYSPGCNVPTAPWLTSATVASIAEIALFDPALADVLAEGDDNGDEYITADESGWVSLP